ncbi:uncharacterized protein LOC135164602 isoform X2 [Diachasmimorpha longicaudata]|uniref:uncharacterized protein LOC135164602 isoform X2 n=1 Tax=Diachasmimorpha longicaudata TaxID=58733 RepID=UPI0030B9060D
MVKWIVPAAFLFALNLSAEPSIVINIPEDGEYRTLSSTYPGFSEKNEDFANLTKHPCHRPCKNHSIPMECYYSFKVESYRTMSKACYDCPQNISHCFLPDCIAADGFERSLQVVNRQLPGPPIEICQGDRLIVDVTNLLFAETTSLHWHGSTFRYHYTAATSGTHFWHSHSGFQRGDGVFGPLIVHPYENRDHHKELYDIDEHIITILDWDHMSGNDKFLAHHHSTGNNKPLNLLVNGLGPYDSNHIDERILMNMPYAEFIVDQGLRHRFRLINAGFLNCPIEVSIDNHTMYIVSTDGNDIKPVKASSLVTYAGERFDFIVEMNRQIDNYWIRFRGLMDCDERFLNVKQKAILRYKGAVKRLPEENEYRVNFRHDSDVNNEPAVVVNALNKGTESTDIISIPLLKSVDPDDEGNLVEPDYQFYLAYDFYDKNNPHFNPKNIYSSHQVAARIFTPQLNHISMKLPNFPLLPQRNSITPDQFCNSSTVGDCKHKYCACTHVLQVNRGSVVELVLVDEGVTYDANHPFHLHGSAFRVIAMQRIGKSVTVDQIKELDAAGRIERRLDSAPIKDTVTVPDGGYTIVRFYADNPGYWLLHCHIEFHVEIGMAVIFKIGEHKEMKSVPVDFPECGNWKPTGPPEFVAKPTFAPNNPVYNEVLIPAKQNINLKDLEYLSSSNTLPLFFQKMVVFITITVMMLF